MVFLTHHHHDHCDALDLVHHMYPKVIHRGRQPRVELIANGLVQARLLCHEKTMSRVESPMKKTVIVDGQSLISEDGAHPNAKQNT